MKVLQTHMYSNGMEQAVACFLRGLDESPQNKCISPSDANVLVEARRNKSFGTILRNFYWNLPDGMPSVWILKLKGAKKATRCSGPDFFEAVMKATAGSPVKHFFLGGAPGVAEDLKKRCESWGNDSISGVYSPPYASHTEMDFAHMARLINESKADIVWIGLGAPKQIYVADQLSKLTHVNYLVTIGAAFDFHTGRVKKAPKWLQQIGMEWFFRLCTQPGRLAKRYLKVIPLFLGYAFIDAIRRK